MLLDERNIIRNVPHHDATFWVLQENSIILVNRDREPMGVLHRVSDVRYEGPALRTARGWRAGLSYFIEKVELTYPLALTWQDGCTEFFKRNRIFLYHGMRNDDVIAPGEVLPFAYIHAQAADEFTLFLQHHARAETAKTFVDVVCADSQGLCHGDSILNSGR